MKLFQIHSLRIEERITALTFLTVLSLLTFTIPAGAWSNGGYSTDLNNPLQGTHDLILEMAINMLPSEMKDKINLSAAYYGSEVPDCRGNTYCFGDVAKHHVYFKADGTHQDDAGAIRAQEEYDLAASSLKSGDTYNFSLHLGAMSHYISDVAVFGHTMGAKTDWGAETHHSDYENYVENHLNSFSGTSFDGAFDGISAYNATLNLAKETTFNSTYTNVWMDKNYNWTNPDYISRTQYLINYDTNLVADVIHKMISSGSKTLMVCPSSCTYSSIQSAINSASGGDTIEVHSGTYYENVNITKQLTLQGIGNPVVDANGSGSALMLSANGITIEGFTASGSLGYYPSIHEAGIHVISNNNILTNNNASKNFKGIYLNFSSNNTLTGNNASNNVDYFGGTGISLYSSSNNTLIGNIASENGGKYGNGISLYNSSSNKLVDNDVNSNANFGITLDSSNNSILISNNAISNGGGGTYRGTGRGISLENSNNNTLSDNNAEWTTGSGIYLLFSDDNVLMGNTLSENGYYDGYYALFLGSGIYLESSRNNKIYNNIFKNNNNFDLHKNKINTWNTTRQSGTNIIGGSFLGGNVWAHPNGTGFSQTCIDADKDGICDDPYVIDSDNIDHLPLTDHIRPKLTVISPNGGENWTQNKSYKIKWSSTGDTGSYVKIQLLKNGTAVKTIKSNTSNDGSVRWKIPYSIAPGTDYKIRIKSKSNPAHRDSSNKKFAIIGAD